MQGGSALVNFFGIKDPPTRVPVTDVHPLYSNLHMIDAYLEGRIMGQALTELRSTLVEPEQVKGEGHQSLPACFPPTPPTGGRTRGECWGKGRHPPSQAGGQPSTLLGTRALVIPICF